MISGTFTFEPPTSSRTNIFNFIIPLNALSNIYDLTVIIHDVRSENTYIDHYDGHGNPVYYRYPIIFHLNGHTVTLPATETDEFYTISLPYESTIPAGSNVTLEVGQTSTLRSYSVNTATNFTGTIGADAGLIASTSTARTIPKITLDFRADEQYILTGTDLNDGYPTIFGLNSIFFESSKNWEWLIDTREKTNDGYPFLKRLPGEGSIVVTTTLSVIRNDIGLRAYCNSKATDIWSRRERIF